MIFPVFLAHHEQDNRDVRRPAAAAVPFGHGAMSDLSPLIAPMKSAGGRASAGRGSYTYIRNPWFTEAHDDVQSFETR
jgi:hypothetical protein